MTKKIALDDVIHGIDLQSDDVTAYLDRETGEVVPIGEDIVYLSERDEPDAWDDWERELVEVLREAEKGSKRYVQLMSKRDVHEWDIMRDFCDTVGDDQVKGLLIQQIQQRGAFRRFTDQLDRCGLLESWFAFKRIALRAHAIEWCAENDIPFE